MIRNQFLTYRYIYSWITCYTYGQMLFSVSCWQLKYLRETEYNNESIATASTKYQAN